MMNAYHRLNAASRYVLGFEADGMIYVIVGKSELVDGCVILDKASRGQGYAIRFKPNRAVKRMLINMGAQVLCSADYFHHMTANSKYNKGEIFEKLVTELMFGQVWEKDNVPFYVDGDVTDTYGIKYQVKFEKATFTNEKSLYNLINR
jgi:hypothetical protein